MRYYNLHMANIISDEHFDYHSKINRNYKAHIQYDGKISEPNHSINFNSIGSYDHSTYRLDFNPTIDIKFGGPIATIGLEIIGGVDTRDTRVLVSYIP